LRREESLNQIYARLLPERIIANKLVIGIQGGKGSFSEDARHSYCSAQNADLSDYQIEYLFTANNVLFELHKGKIDRGVIAIQNTKGGVVMETMHALSQYSCEILDTFDIVISHCILHHPRSNFDDIDTLISHPQAFAQCFGNLNERYAHLILKVGEGNMIDPSLCARYIANDKLPRITSVLASRVCADLYNLTIHDMNLQDLGKANRTTFAWVQRR
jgi:prephenate dehydratase